MSRSVNPLAVTASSDGRSPFGLADHFAVCARLGRYLTYMDSSRFVISDDLAKSVMPSDAVALASICSNDELVARAALMPLGRLGAQGQHRAVYEELFQLIERQALSPKVRAAADHILQSGFLESRIQEIEVSLHDDLNPARQRYRQFLDVVGRLMEGHVSQGFFLDEFMEFTRAVAGKLDFGIYSFCMDRLFQTPRVDEKTKRTLILEIMHFPPLIRRELFSNVLANPQIGPDFKGFVRHGVQLHLDKERALEIELLDAVKSQRLSATDIELSLHGATRQTLS